MRTSSIYVFCLLLGWVSCTKKTPQISNTALLEVEGRFLYQEDVQRVIPPNVDKKDSMEIADSYIKKWVTDVLMYENAKRNITNQKEIDDMVEDYRKSLTIHQYQQKMIVQRLPVAPSEEQIKVFYEQYSDQLLLNENVIQGFLLIIPKNAPKLSTVRSWVQSGNTASLGNIEKYSLQNAISYDYFGNKWVSFTEVLKRIPIQVEDPANFISSKRFYETSDSTQQYFLRIESFRKIGQEEPFDMAKNRISIILLNKSKADFISDFENELYTNAVKNEDITFFKSK